MLRARAAEKLPRMHWSECCCTTRKAAIRSERSGFSLFYTRAAGLIRNLAHQRERLVPSTSRDLSVEGLIAGPVKSPGVPFLHCLFPADLFHAGFEVHALG